MGNIDYRNLFFFQPADCTVELLDPVICKGRCRLVQDQHLQPVGCHGAADFYHLLLLDGQTGHLAAHIDLVVRKYFVQNRLGLPDHLFPPASFSKRLMIHNGDCKIFINSQICTDRKFLIAAGNPAEPCDRCRIFLSRIYLSACFNAPRCCRHNSCKYSHQRRFSGSIGTDQPNDLPRPYFQAHMRQRNRRFKFFRNVLQAKTKIRYFFV